MFIFSIEIPNKGVDARRSAWHLDRGMTPDSDRRR